MTNEQKEQIYVIIKCLVVVLCAGLYAFGGMEATWIRRYLMPVVFTAFCLAWNKSSKHIFILPLLILTLCLGYGADVLWLKILKRSIYGLANAVSFGMFMLLKQQWITYVYHIFLVVSACVVFGVWNPLTARAEETLLGLCIVLLPLMYLPKEEQS